MEWKKFTPFLRRDDGSMAQDNRRLAVVDAHFHLDLSSSPELEADKIGAQEVHTIAVTNVPSVYHLTEAIARGRKNIYAAVGLHPELVESHAHEAARLWSLLERTRFVGEVGLDYVASNEIVRREQRRVFSQILERCAEYGNKILTVHSRRAAADVIDAVGEGFPGTVILHWFSGTRKQLRRAVDQGLWFSVNPAMARSDGGRQLVAGMPRERVLTESDGPFVKCRGRPAVPADTGVVVRALADLWQCSGEHAKATIEGNFLGLVGCPELVREG